MSGKKLKRRGGWITMTEVKTSEDVIMELKAEIEALKCAIAEQQEKAEAKRMLAAVKPVIEKYEEPGRAAVAKVGTRVSDNPFLSVVIAFGAGIVIGKLLDYCCWRSEEE